MHTEITVVIKLEVQTDDSIIATFPDGETRTYKNKRTASRAMGVAHNRAWSAHVTAYRLQGRGPDTPALTWDYEWSTAQPARPLMWTIVDNENAQEHDGPPAIGECVRVVAHTASEDDAVAWLGTQDAGKVARGDYGIDGPPVEHKARTHYDATGQIIAYEMGELDEDEMHELFQHLLDTGMIYSLQGSYQRTAQALINTGRI